MSHTKHLFIKALTIALMLTGWIPATLTRLSAQINTETMMNVGRNALYFHDYVLSIQYFNIVINSKPYLYQPYFYRGLSKYYLEDFSGALSDFEEVIRLNPYYTDTYQLRGLCHINMSDYSHAADDFRKSYEAEPNNKGFFHNIVYCYMQMDSLNMAELEADSLLRRWPDYPDGLLLLANIKIKQKNWEAADSCAERILLKDSLHQGAHRLKSGYYIEKKEWDKAISHLDTILHRNPSSINTLNLKANILLYNKEYQKAETVLTQSLELQPKDIRNLMNRAVCFYYLDNLRGQMKDYDTILELDPENFFAHYNRGQLRAFVGEDNKAIEDFNYIISKDPDDMMAIFNRAVLYDKIGEYRKAIRDLNKVIKEFPKFNDGYRMRAEAKRKIGDTQGAIRDEEHYMKESIAHQFGYSTPTSQMKDKAMRHRSEINLDNYEQLVADEESEKEPEMLAEEQGYKSEYRGRIQNKKVEAKLLDELKVDNSLFPKAVTLYNQGCQAARNGKPDQATELFTQAIQERPDFAEAFFNRGLLHIFKDEIKQGIADLSMSGQMGIYSAYSIIKQYQNKR